ncbi:hypothetical protein AYY26_20945 [Photobacterium phosphoreum]|uniref:hypothetical protein n=1 Tax=Photobacterium phosphoreum TaxID=659 RepID=UPI0007F97EFB|nr:hypothetical protein [Photobacterium phosphoreum]OBU41475.1 hypothetical protein AYY26_20945 [Photobacterium phosphoreum]
MSFLNIVQRGNIKRIEELHELGQRPDAIVNLFRKHGISISIDLVNIVISGELHEFDRIPLPKSVIHNLKSEIDDLANGLMPA